MCPQNEIILSLSRILEARRPVKLINNYKGVPIHYDAVILEVAEREATFKVHPYQCVGLKLDQQTFIQSEGIEYSVRANLKSVDFVAKIAVLEDFLYAPDTIGSRAAIRVQPEDAVDVVILSRNRKIPGQLADISMVGMGIYSFSAYIDNPAFIKRGISVTVVLALHEVNGFEDITLKGIIQNIARERDVYRLGIRTNPADTAQRIMNEYIDSRKQEVLREIEDTYQQVFQLSFHDEGLA
jgi:hypothetical protein